MGLSSLKGDLGGNALPMQAKCIWDMTVKWASDIYGTWQEIQDSKFRCLARFLQLLSMTEGEEPLNNFKWRILSDWYICFAEKYLVNPI